MEKELEKIKIMKEHISTKYKEISSIYINNNKNINRGHVPAMSVIFENYFAEMLSEMLGEYFKIYIDCTIDGGSRPDIIITKIENNEEIIKAIIELKSNLGYCRTNSKEIKNSIEKSLSNINKLDKININFTRQERSIYENKEFLGILDKKNQEKILKNIEMKKEKSITIKHKVKKDKDVKYMLISLSSNNINIDKIEAYENTFNNGNEKRFCILFDGWYYDLKDRDDDLNNFIEFVNRIKNN